MDEKASHDELVKQFVYDTEEYRFIEKNSISIKTVRKTNHDRFEVIYSVEAVMDEAIETFWRLKFR